MKTQTCSHSYSDESRIDCYANYLSEDLILNSLEGSSTTLSATLQSLHDILIKNTRCLLSKIWASEW